MFFGDGIRCFKSQPAGRLEAVAWVVAGMPEYEYKLDSRFAKKPQAALDELSTNALLLRIGYDGQGG